MRGAIYWDIINIMLTNPFLTLTPIGCFVYRIDLKEGII